jgi:hypothetical protein
LELSDNLFPSAVLPLSMSAKRFSWFSMLASLPCPLHFGRTRAPVPQSRSRLVVVQWFLFV